MQWEQPPSTSTMSTNDLAYQIRSSQAGTRASHPNCSRNLGRILGIKLAMSTAYHSQTDRETEIYLRIFCSNNPENWKHLLPTAESAHNQRTHSIQKNSPFYRMMGYEPKSMPLPYTKTNVPKLGQRIILLQRARDEALATHELARQLVAERIHRNFTPFKKGEKVWLEAKNLKTTHLTKKLAPKQEGPFLVKEVLNPLNYQLSLPKQWRIHPVFHATLLTPYKETEAHGPNFLEPLPDLIEGGKEYEVEAIIGHKKKGRGLHYLVKWLGYPTLENSWEPEGNLTHAKEILSDYRKKRRI